MAEQYNLPADSEKYKGEFIVFFPDAENPKVLFHSVVADEAYKKAEEILATEKLRPTVLLVQTSGDNLAQLLAFA
jgi:hypothetical protein